MESNEDLQQTCIKSHMNFFYNKETTKQIEQENNFLKIIYPDGYEHIELPIIKIAEHCPTCTARILFIERAFIGLTKNNVTLFCNCINCNNNFIIEKLKITQIHN